MKIPGDESGDNAATVTLRGLADKAKVAQKQQPTASTPSADQSVDQTKSSDSIKVSELTQMIRSELDPEKMKVERQNHVDRIKKLVQEGKYTSSSHDVAKSFALEVLTESALLSGDADDAAL